MWQLGVWAWINRDIKYLLNLSCLINDCNLGWPKCFLGFLFEKSVCMNAITMYSCFCLWTCNALEQTTCRITDFGTRCVLLEHGTTTWACVSRHSHLNRQSCRCPNKVATVEPIHGKRIRHKVGYTHRDMMIVQIRRVPVRHAATLRQQISPDWDDLKAHGVTSRITNIDGGHEVSNNRIRTQLWLYLWRPVVRHVFGFHSPSDRGIQLPQISGLIKYNRDSSQKCRSAPNLDK